MRVTQQPCDTLGDQKPLCLLKVLSDRLISMK